MGSEQKWERDVSDYERAGINGHDLDNYITGHYGEDQFKYEQPDGFTEEDGLKCNDCGHVFETADAGPALYECGSCGTVFNRNNSADGGSHQVLTATSSRPSSKTILAPNASAAKTWKR